MPIAVCALFIFLAIPIWIAFVLIAFEAKYSKSVSRAVVFAVLSFVLWLGVLIWTIASSVTLTSKLVSTEIVPIQTIYKAGQQPQQFIVIGNKVFDLTEQTGCYFRPEVSSVLVKRWSHRSIGISYGINGIGAAPAWSKAELEFEIMASTPTEKP